MGVPQADEIAVVVELGLEDVRAGVLNNVKVEATVSLADESDGGEEDLNKVHFVVDTAYELWKVMWS